MQGRLGQSPPTIDSFFPPRQSDKVSPSSHSRRKKRSKKKKKKRNQKTAVLQSSSPCNTLFQTHPRFISCPFPLLNRFLHSTSFFPMWPLHSHQLGPELCLHATVRQGRGRRRELTTDSSYSIWLSRRHYLLLRRISVRATAATKLQYGVMLSSCSCSSSVP